jgi:hypothetical protein
MHPTCFLPALEYSRILPTLFVVLTSVQEPFQVTPHTAKQMLAGGAGLERLIVDNTGMHKPIKSTVTLASVVVCFLLAPSRSELNTIVPCLLLVVS